MTRLKAVWIVCLAWSLCAGAELAERDLIIQIRDLRASNVGESYRLSVSVVNPERYEEKSRLLARIAYLHQVKQEIDHRMKASWLLFDIDSRRSEWIRDMEELDRRIAELQQAVDPILHIDWLNQKSGKMWAGADSNHARRLSIPLVFPWRDLWAKSHISFQIGTPLRLQIMLRRVGIAHLFTRPVTLEVNFRRDFPREQLLHVSDKERQIELDLLLEWRTSQACQDQIAGN